MNKKTAVFDIYGKKAKEVPVPEFFFHPIREDIVAKILEGKKRAQPYSSSPVAGKQHAASGKIVHRRHVWRSGYGRGQSRIPRKITSRSGSQFRWIGAEVASTRGGRRAHPPKTITMINYGKANKKEAKLAFLSALSATADKKHVASKYGRINEKDIKELPLIVESGVTKLKSKELVTGLMKILGENLFQIALRRKEVRRGKGKRRGRRYKKTAGVLLVLGKKENMKVKIADTKSVHNLGISDLASGGLGRLTVYTEQAIKDLEERFSGGKKKK